jgi:hypothetical protein
MSTTPQCRKGYVMTDLHERLRDADGGPVTTPDPSHVMRRGRRLATYRVSGIAAILVAVVALAGTAILTAAPDPEPPVVDTPPPGVGAPADLDLDDAVRAEVYRLAPEGAETADGNDRYLETSASVGLAQPAIDDLREAHYIDVDEQDLPRPDREVIFLDADDEPLERLHHYDELLTWDDYEVEGRWVHNGRPLTATTPETVGQTDDGIYPEGSGPVD